MSREIRFRGWDLNEKVMMYNDESAEHDVSYWDGVEASKVELVNHTLDSSSILNTVEWMQFTGLFDKNDTPIYEGDIVQPSAYIKSNLNLSEIVFKDGLFQLGGKGTHGTLIESLRASRAANNDYLVIGNVHSNPELLEIKK